jgi:hypothetical protein
MKKIAPKDLPSNLKKSRQNIDEIGRTSQGAPQPKISANGKKFLESVRLKKLGKKKGYSLGDAMKELNNK